MGRPEAINYKIKGGRSQGGLWIRMPEGQVPLAGQKPTIHKGTAELVHLSKFVNRPFFS